MAFINRQKIHYDEQTGEYINCSVSRGFPLGGMGSGCFNIGSDGWFTEFRTNNNWMAPIKNVRGTFFAVFTDDGCSKASRILRLAGSQKEYKNIRPIAGTRFRGELPKFELSFEDHLPVNFKLKGFTPHIPHNIKDSTLPGVIFTMEITNTGDSSVFVSTLFSLENILGLGGTGFSGFKLIGKYPIGFKKQLKYKKIEGNYQEISDEGDHPGIVYRTRQTPAPLSHRCSTIGEYRLTALPPGGFEVSACRDWPVDDETPSMLSQFNLSGNILSSGHGTNGLTGTKNAGALAVSGNIAKNTTIKISFSFVWWLPDHVTEKDAPRKQKSSHHHGKRVGHVYENYFSSSSQITDYLLKEKNRLYENSMVLPNIIDQSTLPAWMKRVLKNATVSAYCNTVIPKNGTMYTLEGTDWFWPYGGLTGTNDQRLSSHPYTSTFFTKLDKHEVNSFRKLMDKNGSIPHGNGNCDFALGDADVPYGWPVEVKFFMPAQNWTDLTMSEIIQAGKLYRITGDKAWIKKFWPDMKKMADYLDSICRHGVPEGGTTFDVWDFPGTFIYSATVYLAALATMKDLALEVEKETFEIYHRRYDTCQNRINDALWQENEGYFKSAPDKETLFTASMAGDWVSRYAGLDPVIENKKACRHMELQYKTLIKTPVEKARRKGKKAIPWAQARKDGKKITIKNIAGLASEELIYIWQVLSYHAMEHIYLGQVQMGLDVIKMIYDRLYKKGYAWSAGLMGGNDSIYMTNTVIWAVLNAITGAALDVPRGILTLSPQKLPEQREIKIPVCFPGFWAMMAYNSDDGTIALKVIKHFGDPVVINTIKLNNKLIRLETPMALSKGAGWENRVEE